LSPVELTPEERQWLEQHPQIRPGVDADWAPLEFIDGEGVYKGISSDYMALFARQLGIDWVQPQRLPWQQVLDGLRSRRLDVAPLVTATEQRLEYLSFTSPYLNLPIVIFDRRGERLLSGLDDLRGRRVGVVAGYAIAELLGRDYPERELVPYPTILDGLKATALGENDAFVGALAVGGYLISKEGLSNIEVAASTPYRSRLAIGVRKDWPELVGIFDKLIDSVSEKQRNAIFRHWLTVTYDHQVDYTLLWRVLGAALVVLLLGSVWMLQIKRHNKELDEGRQRLSMALEAAELGTWEAYYTADGEVVIMVDDQFAWQHRLPRESRRFSQAEFFRYVTPEAARAIQSALESYQQGEVASLTVEYQTRDRGRWIFSQGRALMRGGAGRSRQVIGISQDISGRKEAEAAMEQASRFKSEFLANMSHEIRTPMNAIVGLGHLLSRSDLGPKQFGYVDKIQLSAQSLLGIIDDILDFSKIEAGHLSIESIEFSLEDVLEHLATLTTTRIESKPVEFIYQLDTRVPDRLVGDPYRIGQVLTNLVSNAVKFTERGSIVVKVALDEQESGERGRTWLRFEVEDTGIGMDQVKFYKEW